MRVSLLLLTGLLLTACSMPRGPTRSRVFLPAMQLEDSGGLSGVARITPELYRGAQPTKAGYTRLKDMGVKTVISFRRFNDSRAEVEAAGLEFVRIPIYASIGSNPPTDEQLQVFFDTVLDPAKQPVFMHCKHGKDRTGMMAALFRIERQCWTNQEAVDEMQAFGYHDVFRDLIGFVRDYEARIFEPPLAKPGEQASHSR
ncbi:MAG: tyrosine-protein phosphatase SIW14 [Planctomycetota bacterium]|jgi:tyrosine-protein phosphatase SIW14